MLVFGVFNTVIWDVFITFLHQHKATKTADTGDDAEHGAFFTLC